MVTGPWRLRAAAIISVLAATACQSAPPTQPANATTPHGVTGEAHMVAPDLAANSASSGPFLSAFVYYSATAPANRALRIASVGARVAGELKYRPGVIAATIPDEAIGRVRRLPWVDSVHVSGDRAFSLGRRNSPESYWPYDSLTWGYDSMGVDIVQNDRGYKGTGVKVAVIDHGIDCSFQDLQAQVKGGYDFIDGDSQPCISGSDADHATRVASIIAAAQNQWGTLGIAPEVSIYSLRGCSTNGCYDSDLALSFNWSITHGMQVINYSLGNCGGGVSGELEDGVDAAYAHGIVIAAGAGNGYAPQPNGQSECQADDPVSYVARLSSTIGVSEYNQDGSYVATDQHGTGIDVAAPSQVTTWSILFQRWQDAGGTSFATPHASGLAALLISSGITDPDLIKRRIIETAQDRGPQGWDAYYGWGTVRADMAVVRPPHVSTLSTPASPIYNAGTYSAVASTADGITPIDVRWDIDYSPSYVYDIHTGWGAHSITFNVPTGSYSITISATPRERTYHRIGGAQTKTIYVCTGASAVPVTSLPSSAGPNVVYGCLPPPPPPAAPIANSNR